MRNSDTLLQQHRQAWWRRWLAHSLALLLVWQPLLVSAGGITAVNNSGERSTVDQAASGVPVINIANPNQAGVSQNFYTDFNVGNKGVVFNNGQKLTQTQLGGYIEGNPNLRSGPASVILNEVIGTNPSALNGYMEVGGARADLIIANPNGISCSGCGFINTNHATLTTGKAIMEGDGSLGGFDVNQGTIRIHGDGVNASNVDRFDVIARSVKVAADIHANSLNVVAGQQHVDRTSLARSQISSDDQKPQFAIDSTELGGMYANRIRLIATEDGVGVRLNAPVAAQNGDLQLSSNGNLRFSDISAKGDMQIDAASNVVSTGKVVASDNLSLEGSKITLQGEQLSGRQVDIQADDLQVDSGASVLGVEALTATGNNMNIAGELAGEVVQLAASGQINNSGSVLANTDIALDAANVTNSGKVFAQQNLVLDADSVMNSGQLHSGGSQTITAGEVINTGSLVAAQDFSVTADSFTQTSSIDTQASLESGGELTLSTGVLNNEARIAAAGNATLTSSGDLTNRGEITAEGTLDLQAGGQFHNGGEILGLTSLTASAQALSNDGELQAVQDLSVSADQISNAGLMQANGTLSLASIVGSLLNQGAVEAGQRLQVTAAGLSNEAGAELISRQQLDLSIAGDVNNAGLIQAGQSDSLAADGISLTLNAANLVNGADANLLSFGAMSVATDLTLINRGVMSSDQNMNLIAGDISNQQGGLLQASSDLEITANTVKNHQGANVKSQGDLTVDEGTESLTNHGVMIGHGVLTVHAQKVLNKRRADAPQGSFNGTLGGLGGVRIVADQLINRGGATLGANGDMTLLITDLLRNELSTIVAQGNLFIAAAEPDFSEAKSEADVLAAIDAAKTNWVVNDRGQILALQTEPDGNESQSGSGSLTVYAHSLRNIRPRPDIGQTPGLSAMDFMEAAWEDLQNNLASGTEQDALIHLLYNERYAPVTQNKEDWLLLFDPDLYKLGVYWPKEEARQVWVAVWLNKYAQYLNDELPGLIDSDTKQAIREVLIGNYVPGGSGRLGSLGGWEGGEADYIGKGGVGDNPLAVTFYLVPRIAQLLKQQDPAAYQRLVSHMTQKLENYRGDLTLWQNGCGKGGSDWMAGGDACDNFHRRSHEFTNGYEQVVTAAEPQARLISDGDMALHVDTLDNYYSLINAGGDLLIRGDTLENKAYELKRYFDYHRVDISGHNRDIKWMSDYGPRQESLPTGNVIASIIGAAGQMTLDIDEVGNHTEELHDQTMVFDDQHYALEASEEGSAQTGEVPAEEPAYTDWGDSEVTRVIDTVNTRTLALLERHDSFFIVNRNPNHPYLIETNPLFNTLGGFLGSGYLIDRLGLNPNVTQRRLGDSYYENTLVRDAVLAATGTRFLDPNFRSDKEQFQWLMNNALAAAESMELSVGVSLSAAQINELQKDIVWLEERQVAGYTVLVPVLYLAPGSQHLTGQGAVIAANQVTITTEGLGNSGMIASRQDLVVNAGDKGVVNLEGTLQAGGQLLIDSRGDIKNQSGTLQGNGVVLQSQGDIIHEVWSEQVDGKHSSGTYSYTNHRDAGVIESSGDVVLNAGENIQITGSDISGGNVGLQAGGNIDISSLEVRDESQGSTLTSRFETRTVRQLASNIEATLNIMATAGQSIGITASNLNAGEDIALSAVNGDIVVLAAANEDYEHFHSEESGEETTATNHTITQQQSALSAGGNLSLNAGNDLIAIAAKLQSGGDMSLSAGNNIALLAAQNSDYHLYENDKDGDYGAKSHRKDEIHKVTNLGTTLDAGGNLTIDSGGDQHYQAARLQSGGDIHIVSGGHITFEAVKDLYKETHEKSQGDLAWNKMANKGQIDETVLQTEIVAQGNLAIDAAQGLSIDLKEINQATVSEMIDGMVANNPELAWLKEAEARGDVDWRQVKEVHDSWDESSQSMGAATALVVAIVVTVLTAGVGATAGTAVAGVTSTGAAGAAATAAVVTSAAVTGTSTLINNQGDLGATLDSLDHSETYQGLAVSGLTAGLMSGVDNLFSKWDYGKVSTDTANNLTKGFDLNSAKGIAGFTLHNTAQAAVSAGVSSSIYGTSFTDALNANLESQGNNVLSALAFNQAGNLATYMYGSTRSDTLAALWKEGGLAHVGLHAAVGGAVTEITSGDFATGAAAAGMNQLLSKPLDHAAKAGESSLFGGGYDGWRVAGAQLAGLAGAIAVDGDVNDGAWVAKQADTYNRQLHKEETARITVLRDGKTPEEKHRLNAAACYLTRCAEGVPSDDEHKAFLAALQQEGGSYQGEISQLEETGLFKYGGWDKVNDYLLKHEEGAQRVGGAVNVAGGISGTVAGGGLAIGGCAYSAGLLCGASVGGGSAIIALSYNQGVNGLHALTSDYSSGVGADVINAFGLDTYPGESAPATDLALSLFTTVIETGVGAASVKVAKYTDDLVSGWSFGSKQLDDVELDTMYPEFFSSTNDTPFENIQTLVYRHQLKVDKETDIDELNRQLSGQENGFNRIIEVEGIEGLQQRILNYRESPSVEAEGRAFGRTQERAAPGNALLHEPDMATGGLPTDIYGEGDSRINSIIGGNARRISDEILSMPCDTSRIVCDLLLIPPR